MPRNQLNTLLSHLAEAAHALSEKEVTAVLEGRARVVIQVEKVRYSKQSRRNNSGVDDRKSIALQEAADSLRGMATREAGQSFLQTHFKSRSDLLRLARMLDLPVGERDPRNRMEEKIVDATIGFRLRSDAIQNRSDT